MARLWIAVGILNAGVELLLLLGVGRLCGDLPELRRAAPAAVLGGTHAAACLIPGFSFLGNLLWRLVCQVLMVLLCYGMKGTSLRKGGLFFLLHMALEGLVSGGKPGMLVLGAVLILLLCAVGFPAGGRTVPVELCCRGKTVNLLALHDTGNTLRDPVSGQPVLVVDASVAGKLLGLTGEQLKKPVETLTQRTIPGLRLIPYYAVGTGSSMMLGLRCDRVTIGGKQAGRMVAFAPECFPGTYQGLTGGAYG